LLTHEIAVATNENWEDEVDAQRIEENYEDEILPHHDRGKASDQTFAVN